MRYLSFIKKPEALAFFLVFLATFLVAMRISAGGVEYSDFVAHHNISKHFSTDFFTINFFYYLINYLTIIVTKNTETALIVFLVLFSLLHATKALFAAREFQTNLGADVSASAVFVLALGCSVATAYLIPSLQQNFSKLFNPAGNHVFMNRFYLNVWHNGTSMLLYPISILLVSLTAKQLTPTQTSTQTALYTFLLMLLSVTVKPSLVMVYFPAVCVYILFDGNTFAQKLKHNKLLIASMALVFLVILVQFSAIYFSESVFDKLRYGGQKSEMSFAFNSFFWPSSNSAWYNILLLFSPFIFPLFVMLRHKRVLYTNRALQLSLLMTVFSIIIALFVVEVGPRKNHHNFIWSATIASFTLFLFCTLAYAKIKPLSASLGWLLWLGHVLFGLLYIVKILIWGNYA